MKKIILPVFLFVLLSSPLASAQKGFVLHSVIPSSNQVSSSMKIVPTILPTCDTNNVGEIRNDQATNAMVTCNGTDWVSIDGMWAKTGTVIHTADLLDYVSLGSTDRHFRLTLGNHNDDTDGSIISMGKFGLGDDLIVTGPGTRFIVYHKKGAIRFQTSSGFGPMSGAEMDNSNIGEYSTGSGGLDNAATAYGSTVGGGAGNTASGFYTTIGGGTTNNVDSWANGTIAGGQQNRAGQLGAFVGGGGGNESLAIYSSISGGLNNEASGNLSAVSGGWKNEATNHISFIGGGEFNTASGHGSTITGGARNVSAGDWSWATGTYVQVNGDRSFGFGHGSSASPVVINDDDVAVFPTSKVGVGEESPDYRLDVNGDIGGTFDGTNKGEIKIKFAGTGPTAGYYAVYAP